MHRALSRHFLYFVIWREPANAAVSCLFCTWCMKFAPLVGLNRMQTLIFCWGTWEDGVTYSPSHAWKLPKIFSFIFRNAFSTLYSVIGITNRQTKRIESFIRFKVVCVVAVTLFFIKHHKKESRGVISDDLAGQLTGSLLKGHFGIRGFVFIVPVAWLLIPSLLNAIWGF